MADGKTEMIPPLASRYSIQNLMSKKFIDLPGGAPNQDKKNGKIQLWDMDYQPDRYFSLSATKGENEYFVISPLHTTYYFDVENGSKDDRANIRLWDLNNTSAQLFKFVYAGAPMTYYIINKNSGKAIDASESQVHKNGCKIFQYKFHGKDNQKWKLHKIPTWSMPDKNQAFYIKTAYSNKYFDLPGGGKDTNKNGLNFKIWDFDRGGDRKYKFIPSGDHSWINIQVQNGGKYMAIPSNSNNL